MLFSLFGFNLAKFWVIQWIWSFSLNYQETSLCNLFTSQGDVNRSIEDFCWEAWWKPYRCIEPLNTSGCWVSLVAEIRILSDLAQLFWSSLFFPRMMVPLGWFCCCRTNLGLTVCSRFVLGKQGFLFNCERWSAFITAMMFHLVLIRGGYQTDFLLVFIFSAVSEKLDKIVSVSQGRIQRVSLAPAIGFHGNGQGSHMSRTAEMHPVHT